MRIVINALQYKQNSSGIGVMIRELFVPYTFLTRETCQVILSQDSPDFPGASETEVVRIPWQYGNGLRRMLFQSFGLGRLYCRNAVLLATDSKVPFFLPRSCVVASVITDLAVYRMPKVYKASRVVLWRLQYRYLKRRAHVFFAISQFTKREMTELLHIPAEKIYVVPCACPTRRVRLSDPRRIAELREKYALPEQYVLFVGNANPRKNLLRMIQAFSLAKQRGNLPHQLVIAGEHGWKFSAEETLREIPCKDAIRFLGFVPDEDMSALYSAASLFVFPTLYEGFGIPVLEAQVCGTPVLASNCSAIPEVGGEGALYVNPYDVEDIGRGILKVLRDPDLAERLVEKGYRNAERFSWQDSAERLNRMLEKEVEQL